MNNEKRPEYRRQLRLYVSWPIIISCLMALFAVIMLFLDTKTGITACVFAVIMIALSITVRLLNKNAIANDMVNFAVRYGQVQKELIRDLPIPYALLDDNARFVWCNGCFSKVLGRSDSFGKSIASFVPQINKDKFPTDNDPVNIIFTKDNKTYSNIWNDS